MTPNTKIQGVLGALMGPDPIKASLAKSKLQDYLDEEFFRLLEDESSEAESDVEALHQTLQSLLSMGNVLFLRILLLEDRTGTMAKYLDKLGGLSSPVVEAVPSEIIKLKGAKEYRIKGRGLVLSVDKLKNTQSFTVGSIVEHKGELYDVTGVEFSGTIGMGLVVSPKEA